VHLPTLTETGDKKIMEVEEQEEVKKKGSLTANVNIRQRSS
jgi:hypothetical protein